MASIRIFMFSYDSSLCTEWPTGIEGRVLPSWRRTALRLKLDKSVKNCQSRGLWIISLVNTQNVSVTKIVDPFSIHCAESRYGVRIQFLALVAMTHEAWLNAYNSFYALSHTSCIMTTRAKNWILRPYLDSAHWIEEESTILVTDTFCMLTSVIDLRRKLNKLWSAFRIIFLCYPRNSVPSYPKIIPHN